ncbi:MAG: right-handed parallel beta-helix repeat-containing protein [Thermodesulfobacteriota bacterium]
MRLLPSCPVLLCCLLLTACAGEKPTELPMTTLDRDTTWQGNLVLNGDVFVPVGVTLTVAPGTTVSFRRIDEKSDQNMFGIDSPYYPQAELIVQGRLLARGTKEQPIVFTSAETNARPADWGAINFLGGDGNVVEHAKILCAYNGIHAHGAEVTVRHSEFVKNGVGISFKSEEETPGVPWFGKRSQLVIEHSLFANNKGGIGFRNSSGTIRHNEIRDNKFFGIWPKEDADVEITRNEIVRNRKGIYLFQVRGLRLEFNNIHDNTDYNISPAEAQDYELAAPNNWFGTINRQKIDETIFDRKDDPDLAEVKIDPIATKAIDWEGGQ